jgi:hypothetical protein
MKKDITPLFIISLPRTGSTLLQRILASASQISSVSEPWILLPLLGRLKPWICRSVHGHNDEIKAFNDLIHELRNKIETHYAAVRSYYETIYTNITESEKSDFFLDKSPPYCLICDEIIKCFPNAKFIFLFRNPISVISSCLETFYRNRFLISRSEVYLYDGLATMVEAYNNFQSKILKLKYEDLINDPQGSLENISQYLNINVDKNSIEFFSSVKFSGRLGDPTGAKQYSTITRDTLDKWKINMNTPWRSKYVRAYLRWIGAERLSQMGYNMDTLLDEVESVPLKWDHLFSDPIIYYYDQLGRILGRDLKATLSPLTHHTNLEHILR